MTAPETSYMKNITNELSFLLVTYTTHFERTVWLLQYFELLF
jgi:hypothetical protein